MSKIENTGAISPGTVANDTGIGSTAWSDVANAATSDDNWATAVLTTGTPSNWLKFTNFDFSAVPTDANIDGVVVTIERHQATGSAYIKDNSVKLVDSDGSAGGDDKAAADLWTVTLDGTATYGGASDTWGAVPTAAMVRNSNFGVALSATVSDTQPNYTAYVDAATMTVYYHLTNEGENSPGTVASVSGSGGTAAWSNPNNAKASDNAYASVAVVTGNGEAYSQYLKATNFAFSTYIDDAATINGVIVEIERYGDSGGTIKDYGSPKLVNAAGTIAGDSKANASAWATSDPNTYATYGGSTDTWGITGLRGADAKDSDFGVVLAIQYASGAGTVTAYVDHIRMTVYYTNPSGLTTGQTAAPLISKRCGFVGAKYERGG